MISNVYLFVAKYNQQKIRIISDHELKKRCTSKMPNLARTYIYRHPVRGVLISKTNFVERNKLGHDIESLTSYDHLMYESRKKCNLFFMSLKLI